jgi:ribosomal protein S18 acetylase RimI-like enzyme
MNNTEYYVSSDKSKLDIEAVKRLLKQSYWANERPVERILKSIEHSVCYGVYNNNEQVGFGRVVTDYATVFYLCDIIIDERHRGRGLGKMLMENIMASRDLEGLQGILATEDAHGLYEKYSFVKEQRKLMLRKRNIGC